MDIEDFLKEHNGIVLIIRRNLDAGYFFFNPRAETERLRIGSLNSVIGYINEKMIMPSLNRHENYYLCCGDGTYQPELRLRVFIHEEVIEDIERLRDIEKKEVV